MLKRLLLFVLIMLSLLMGCPGIAEEPVNLLQNASFENLDEEGNPIAWFTDAYVLRTGVTQFSVSETARTGQHAIMIENFDMNDARFAQTVKVEPNSIYRLSGWVCADHILDAGHGANLSIEGVYIFSDSLYETNGEWTFLELYGRTGKDQKTVTVFARVGGYSGESQGAAWFDDLVLEKVKEAPGTVYPHPWYVDKTAAAVQETTPASTPQSSPFYPWLLLIGSLYMAGAFWLMRHLQLDERSKFNDLLEQKHRAIPAYAVIGMVLAAVLRVFVALKVDGYQVDVNCFTSWGNTMVNNGPWKFYQSTWCDYTPGYIYTLGLNGWLAKLLQGVVSAAFVHKLVPMACDLVGAWLIFKLACENDYSIRQSALLAILFAFNPATIINSAAWCQIDSVLCLLLMLVAYFAIHRKWSAVLPLYVVAILVKPQALMLGFLGLAAIFMEDIEASKEQSNRKRFWKEMGIGLGISALAAAIIILPFCPNQDSPWWLIEQYSETLASYPYATVNTANLFYLFDANWDEIANAAAPGTCVFFFIAAAVWASYAAWRQYGKVPLWYVEPALNALYALIYLVLAITGCSWTVLGIVSMSMAFAIVLPVFIRSGKLTNLPLCGAVLFLLLYVFGIKMHERYLFPAIFLLGMAYALHRDRRILGLLIGASFVLFVNEGIVLDNSIRLGSSMGHLNADTLTLAKLLSILNVGLAMVGVWTCHRIGIEMSPTRFQASLGKPLLPVRKYQNSPCTPLNHKTDAALNLTKWDAILMLSVTLVYSIVTLTTLGSTKAPQTAWKSTASEERVCIDLGQHYDDFSMLYFAQVSYSNFAVEVSDDRRFGAGDEVASESGYYEYPAQMAEGMCFSWQYLDPSYKSNGNDTFVNASDFSSVQKLSGRYVRIKACQAGLVLNEIIFKDAQGNIIPGVTIIGHENANNRSPNYSDPANLLDEQDTLDGEPSWWNSTYFDEIYHARTAYELLHNQSVYEWTHPPLGKIIMSWFIAIFGMTPFGWRFGGALCGIMMLPVMYLLVKQLTKRSNMAFMAMLLMTLDCMHFTQTRIATIDSYPVLFIMLSYFFMLRFMQRDIVLSKVRTLLPDLAFSGFFMGCGFASKWIGAYAGLGLAVLFFWTCLRHLRMSRMAAAMQMENNARPAEEHTILDKRAKTAFMRVFILCLWCLLFFVTIPVIIYLLAYADRFANREFANVFAFLKEVLRENFADYGSMLWYHSQPRLGMDHAFYSPWYEWPLMMKPMYYASAAFKPEGMTYAIFCFGNPWVWLPGLLGIGYTAFIWAKGHRYLREGSDSTFQLYRSDWDVGPAFILIGLMAQFLPWVLVPRGTYIYHYFASVPFLILGTVMLLHHLTLRLPKAGEIICFVYLGVCLLWFILLFPYSSGLITPNWWMDFVRDYPYISLIPNYWESDWLTSLNALLEKIPIFPHVYHH